MHFGVDYHPEHWVHPYAGTADEPESRWKRDIELMHAAGVNTVRMGEFAWGLYEPEEGHFEFDWMLRVMDLCREAKIQVVLGTPTAAPPLWLSRKYPAILPVNAQGLRWCEGTRHAACLNSDIFWDYSRKIVRAVAENLGKHPQLIAWQIDNGIGGHTTEFSFNEESRRDWHSWLKAKYETVDKLNSCMGMRFWGQIVRDWSEVPMPMAAPTVHNPALVLDWMRFSSDTLVAYIRMQSEILHEVTPHAPVCTNLRALTRHFDHFDAAEVLDFVALDRNATIFSKFSQNAFELDVMRSVKKSEGRSPDGGRGFWVIEQKAGNVNFQEVNSLVRPGVVRLFTHQAISRGANAVFYFFWRQPRIGSEKFYGGVLTHDGKGENRVYKEITEIGKEIERLAPVLKGTEVVAETCILFSHPNEWTLKLPMQPNRFFNQREHMLLYYNALHDRNIAVDFARPSDDLSKYKMVFAPSLHLLAGAEADALKVYVQNGGILISTFNTGLVDEHHIVPDTGFPNELTDLFGMSVQEFDPLPQGEENHLIFKGAFHATSMHPALTWCDVIEPKECHVLATFAKDFYSGKPAITMNEYGQGKAIYIGTMSHQNFYYDLIAWLRGICNLHPLLKVPDTVEVSMRQNEENRIYFLLNHQNSPVRIQFYKPMHDFLSGNTFSGNYDLPAHGVLVLDEHSKHA